MNALSAPTCSPDLLKSFEAQVHDFLPSTQAGQLMAAASKDTLRTMPKKAGHRQRGPHERR